MDWDKNSDGKISLMEFRQQVKGVGIVRRMYSRQPLRAGQGRSGFLDLSELGVAFKQAIVEANEVEAKARDVQRAGYETGALPGGMERTGE